MTVQLGEPGAQQQRGRVGVALARLAQVAGVESFPGVLRRTLVWGERLMVLHNTFAAGARVPLHGHPQEQITHVIEGTLEITVDDTVYKLSPGDSMLIPSEAQHDTRALVESLVLDIFSPPREEFKR